MQKLVKDPAYRAKVSAGLKAFWNNLTPAEQAVRIARQAASVPVSSRKRQGRKMKRIWRLRKLGRLPRVEHPNGNNGRRYQDNERSWVYSAKAGWIFCRSSWERRFVSHLDKDSDVMDFYNEPFKISVPRLRSSYEPDFLVLRRFEEMELVEIKPRSLCRHPEVRMKFAAARRFCAESDMRFVVVSYD